MFHGCLPGHFMLVSAARWWDAVQHMRVKVGQNRGLSGVGNVATESSLPPSHDCVIPFFKKSQILIAAVACDYVAIICFLASNQCPIAATQSLIVSITNLMAWQRYFKAIGSVHNECLP